MRRAIAVCLTLTASILTVMTVSSPARADDCIKTFVYTTTTGDFGSSFNASINCDGIWAMKVGSIPADWVSGQFKKDGWQNSSLGAQWVVATAGYNKIIGNTVDGRQCRGKTRNYNGTVQYRY